MLVIVRDSTSGFVLLLMTLQPVDYFLYVVFATPTSNIKKGSEED